jgi:hypothetical protein
MNMSYCRFQNTLMDLRDCQENMDDDDLSEEERDARAELIDVCWRIAQDYADKADADDEEQALTEQTIDKYGSSAF